MQIIEQNQETGKSHSSIFTSSVVIASLSAFLGSLDSALNISFPAITAAFSLEVSSIQWVIIGYVLPHASLLLGCGRLADLWGHKRVLTYGLLVTVVGLLGCGLAQTFSWLIAARVAQGIGAALMSGSAPALVTLAVPADVRGRALGILQMSMAAGYAIGPLIGGLLVDTFGWRAVFWFRVFPAILLAWCAAMKLPTLEPQMKAQRFDSVGALTLAGGLAGLLLAITQSRNLGWSSANVMVPALFCAVCLFAFIITEKRASAPVFEWKHFRRPPFVIANFLAVVANGTRFAVGLLVPYYLIAVLDYPATLGGTLMLAAAVMTPLAAPVAGRLSDRYGTAGLSALGLVVQGFGLWMISGLGGGSDYATVSLALGIVGLGLGIFEAPNMSFVMGAIARNQQGVAGSISNMTRTLGIVFGATGWSMLFDARRHFYTSELGVSGAAAAQAFVPAFQDVFFCAAAVCAAAFILALFRRQ